MKNPRAERTVITHNHPTRVWETSIVADEGLIVTTHGVSQAEAESIATEIIRRSPKPDDDQPADREWCATFARSARCVDDFILDEVSTWFYLRFDFGDLDGERTEDCDVLLHRLPNLDEDGIELLEHATRGDVRALLSALRTYPKKLNGGMP